MKLIDLSHRMYDGLKTHASHPRVIINDFMTHAYTAGRHEPPCKGFATTQILISDHAATHVDAPAHFYEQGETIEQQPLDKYFGPAVLLDVSDKLPEQPIDREMMEKVMKRDGLEMLPGDIVLIRAWAGEWGTPEFHNANTVTVEACQWLCKHGMKAIGTDLSNIDYGPLRTRNVHMYLLGEKIPVYENLANLGTIPRKRFLFSGFPLNLQGCTGSPVRAVALLEDE